MLSLPPPPPNDDGAEEEGGGGSRVLSYYAAKYWDARYVEDGATHRTTSTSVQRYDALRPFLGLFTPPVSRLLVIGCGSACTRNRLLSPVICG
jgi:EEF1A lysine methyltransferase 4